MNKNIENLQKIDSEVSESISALSTESKKIYYVTIHNEDGTVENLYSFHPLEINLEKAKIKNYFKPSIKQDQVLEHFISIEYFDGKISKETKEFVWINNKAMIFVEDINQDKYKWVSLNEENAIKNLQELKNMFLLDHCESLNGTILSLQNLLERKDEEISMLQEKNDELFEMIQELKNKYENKRVKRNIEF